MLNIKYTKTNEVVTTKDAAKILNLSVSSIRILANKGIIISWNTPGGHRRYEKNSLLNYKKNLQDKNIINEKICIKIISDENIPITEDLKNLIDVFDIEFWSSLPEAYLSFSSKAPDIIIFNMRIPLKDQIENILALDEYISNMNKKIAAICMGESINLAHNVRQKISGSTKLINEDLTNQWIKSFVLGISSAKFISK